MKGLLVAAMVVLSALPAFAQDKEFRKQVYNSSVQIYILEPLETRTEPSLSPLADAECTGIVFFKYEPREGTKIYSILTAAHCVVNHEAGLPPLIPPYDSILPNSSLYVQIGDPSIVDLLPARLQLLGNMHKGYDIAVLTIETNADIPVIPLGDESQMEIGNRVVSVSAPLGGEIKFWFEGYASAIHPAQIGEYITERVPDWAHAAFFIMPSAYGSSGAGVVSVDQKAIIGIMEGFYQSKNHPEEHIACVVIRASAIRALIREPEKHGAIDLSHRVMTGVFPPKP